MASEHAVLVVQALTGSAEFRLLSDGWVQFWLGGMMVREFSPREWAAIVRAMGMRPSGSCVSGDGGR